MSRYIEPMPINDATVVFSIWKRGEFDYEVTISYAVRGQLGHDSRTWPFRGLDHARKAIPPDKVRIPPDPDDNPQLVESWT